MAFPENFNADAPGVSQRAGFINLYPDGLDKGMGKADLGDTLRQPLDKIKT